MYYSEFVDLYEKLVGTTKKLEKTEILAEFLKKPSIELESEWIYLLRGRVVPDYDASEFGISTQLVIKIIAESSGFSKDKVISEFRKIGDLGEVAEKFMSHKKQNSLFSKRLTTRKVFENLKKIILIEGKGSVDKKVELVSELLFQADSKEAKYIIRTLLNDLRVGVADGILRESFTKAFFEGDNLKEISDLIEEKFDLVNDSALVFESVQKGLNEVKKLTVTPGRPIKAMLAVKAENIEDGFRICGKPAVFEYKYDGFRMFINNKNGKISLFTRKLEEVSSQFPDVIEAVKKQIKGDNYIIDSEIVGYDRKTGKYTPFESISQRIRRKYDIDKLIEKLPVEVNVFDIVYSNGKSLMSEPFIERRKVLEKVVSNKMKVLRLSKLLVTDSVEKAQKFYEESLGQGEEGVMIKRLDAPYRQGRRVGYMAKLKPEVNDLDLVITGAEYGTGKRAGWLTSFFVACRNGDEFLELGRVSSGLKEKEGEGVSYSEITKLLKELIVKENGRFVKVKPKIVVSILYQNIQKSPSYSSKYALRFPRITNYRPDRNISDIATLKDIQKLAI